MIPAPSELHRSTKAYLDLLIKVDQNEANLQTSFIPREQVHTLVAELKVMSKNQFNTEKKGLLLPDQIQNCLRQDKAAIQNLKILKPDGKQLNQQHSYCRQLALYTVFNSATRKTPLPAITPLQLEQSWFPLAGDIAIWVGNSAYIRRLVITYEQGKVIQKDWVKALDTFKPLKDIYMEIFNLTWEQKLSRLEVMPPSTMLQFSRFHQQVIEDMISAKAKELLNTYYRKKDPSQGQGKVVQNTLPESKIISTLHQAEIGFSTKLPDCILDSAKKIQDLLRTVPQHLLPVFLQEFKVDLIIQQIYGQITEAKETILTSLHIFSLLTYRSSQEQMKYLRGDKLLKSLENLLERLSRRTVEVDTPKLRFHIMVILGNMAISSVETRDMIHVQPNLIASLLNNLIKFPPLHEEHATLGWLFSNMTLGSPTPNQHALSLSVEPFSKMCLACNHSPEELIITTLLILWRKLNNARLANDPKSVTSELVAPSLLKFLIAQLPNAKDALACMILNSFRRYQACFSMWQVLEVVNIGCISRRQNLVRLSLEIFRDIVTNTDTNTSHLLFSYQNYMEVSLTLSPQVARSLYVVLSQHKDKPTLLKVLKMLPLCLEIEAKHYQKQEFEQSEMTHSRG